MSRKAFRLVLASASLGVAVLSMAAGTSGQSGMNPVDAGTKNGDWPTYEGDVRGWRYSPADQINAQNFSKMEIAWRFHTDNLGNHPENKLEGTPLEVHGVLYATAGNRRAVVALDAATGELLWVHGEKEGKRGGTAPRQLSGRGLAYWSDGHEERIYYYTMGYRLVALNAKTGQRVSTFADDGILDLKQQMDQDILLDSGEGRGEIGIQSAPVIAKDVIIAGAAFREGMTPKTHKNNKGYVRGFDVRTGKRLWIFHTIPQKGEEGYDTWLNGSADENGNTGMWTQPSVDADLGVAYLPIESPTNDYYGGHRPGNNLYGESVVAVDLKTGQKKWHFQMVHHPIWDMDASSTPLVADINVDGKPIKAVAVPSKQGFLYVFDRVSGKPVWPIEEKPVEKGSVPGEWYSPTQPIPTKPPAYSRNGVSKDDLIDFTPEMRAEAEKIASKYHLGPVFTPGSLSKADGPRATLTLGTASGGTNWPGAAYDPETHIVYAPACNACLTPIGLIPTPSPDVSDMKYIMGTDGEPFRIARGPGEGAGADAEPIPENRPAPPPPPRAGQQPRPQGGGGFTLAVDGLPLIKPPYGVISAINLDKGELMWQIAHGETPDLIRNHPKLKGMNIPRTGQASYNPGLLITKTLIVSGEAQATTTADHPRGAMLRAYDKMTGKEVGAVKLPAPQSGSPMTYVLNGKQYIVVAVSGLNFNPEYIAFAAPTAADRPTNQPQQ